jgi:uncharacterized protein YjaZ
VANVVQAQAERFGQLRQQDLKQIDLLTRALAERQKTIDAVQQKEIALREQSCERESKDAASAADAAELRLQLSVAESTISRLRLQLADASREVKPAASAAWTSSEDVKRMLEEQEEKCVRMLVRHVRSDGIVSNMIFADTVTAANIYPPHCSRCDPHHKPPP